MEIVVRAGMCVYVGRKEGDIGFEVFVFDVDMQRGSEGEACGLEEEE